MKILTTDDRILTLLQMGEPDKEAGSNRLKCRTEKGGVVYIALSQIKCFYGSYTFLH